MLDYLVTSRARRELLRLLWGQDAQGNVSSLSRQAGVSFSTVYKELQAMQTAGLVTAGSEGNEVTFRRNDASPYAAVIRALVEAPKDAGDEAYDDKVRGWLHALGAPLPTPVPTEPAPATADLVADALVLAHRDATVARVLPLVLWRNWRAEDAGAFELAAAHRNERPALGMFLALAGELGCNTEFSVAARGLRDRRRTKCRPFFVVTQGRYALAAARRNTPPVARRWGFLMNMGLDSFKSVFEKHEAT